VEWIQFIAAINVTGGTAARQARIKAREGEATAGPPKIQKIQRKPAMKEKEFAGRHVMISRHVGGHTKKRRPWTFEPST
jgi:hypothetical protein